MTRTSIERLADDAPVSHPDSWPAKQPPQTEAAKDRAFGEAFQARTYRARDACRAALEAQAGRSARAIIKDRARAYAIKPRTLDSIAEGLFTCSPRDLVLALKAINAVATMRGQRWMGIGGEIMAINLKGARLYARWSRRVARRIAMRAAS